MGCCAAGYLQKKKRGEEFHPAGIETLELNQAARLRRIKLSPSRPAARRDIEAGSGVDTDGCPNVSVKEISAGPVEISENTQLKGRFGPENA